jgi:hypothetical protein
MEAGQEFARSKLLTGHESLVFHVQFLQQRLTEQSSANVDAAQTD